MTKKKWIIIGIVVLIILPILIIAGWLYIFSYEECMFTTGTTLCGGSCDFMSVVTHNYCK